MDGPGWRLRIIASLQRGLADRVSAAFLGAVERVVHSLVDGFPVQVFAAVHRNHALVDGQVSYVGKDMAIHRAAQMPGKGDGLSPCRSAGF